MNKDFLESILYLGQLLLRQCRHSASVERVTLTGAVAKGWTLGNLYSWKNSLKVLFLCCCLSACQTPTTVTETDQSMEQRVFSKIEYGKEVELKRSIIVDVRPRFEHEMSRPPRSFNAYWRDWDLRGFKGERLDLKVKELQRLLALNGVDPLTQVVILGKGLKGQGEEFLVASTLLSLGVDRISFLNEKQVKEAMVARGLPKIQNAPYWSKPIRYQWTCTEKVVLNQEKKLAKAEFVVGSKKYKNAVEASQVFSKNLKVVKKTFPKSLRMRVYSPDSLWAYGLAMYFRSQGRTSCVL